MQHSLSNQRRRQQFRHPIHEGAHAAEQVAALRVQQGDGHRFGGEVRQHFDQAAVVQQRRDAGARRLDQAETGEAGAVAYALLTVTAPCIGRVR